MEAKYNRIEEKEQMGAGTMETGLNNRVVDR